MNISIMNIYFQLFYTVFCIIPEIFCKVVGILSGETGSPWSQ